MTLPDPSRTERYSPPAMLLHWLLGAAIVFLFFFGLYMVNLPFSPQKLKFINWHKWIGMLILTLSAVRLLVRLVRRPPALPAQVERAMPRWQHIAHHGTHHAMYLLFFVVPLLGWAYSSAAGFPIVLFGQLPLPDLVSPDAVLAQALKPWHKWAAFALMGLVALHVAAVVKHQLIDRDGLLRRMLPW
ncbi:cytochrome B561 [Lampropedia cohaerens]|uniref:Cytochrome B561 n=1 Tax=Lampropedia cohaerens TaxID=1610491 RepID=A0A0U1Q1T1_9BURK|nr:cytochrome b [Lampropedia cohaerens]KKW68734.1 cytochrome B561 [Lampropedia cohaerens]